MSGQRMADVPASIRKVALRANTILVRMDITVVRLKVNAGEYRYVYQLHKIQDGCCGLFHGKDDSGGAITKDIAEHLYAWALEPDH
ncbi:hypothetical protein PQX77_017773 [Marasmius sp. AFHP31]|nr:hypothetical protein PQX77_017773 [Marasmius sp. AFHP31]